jgi:hypothetical protein
VKSDLEVVSGGSWRSVLVVGEYGTGKSHLLKNILEDCLDNGFAVASCAQDIAGKVALNRPDQVYRRLVGALAFRTIDGETGDLAALANEWAKEAQRVVRQEPKSLSRIYALAKRRLVPCDKDGAPAFKPRVSIALVGYLLALEEQRDDAAKTMLSVLSGAELTNAVADLKTDLGLTCPDISSAQPQQA